MASKNDALFLVKLFVVLADGDLVQWNGVFATSRAWAIDSDGAICQMLILSNNFSKASEKPSKPSPSSSTLNTTSPLPVRT